MRFHVAGVGSVGSLLAHHLRKTLDPRHTITLLHKTEERRCNVSKRDPTISIVSGGVTQTSSGFSHELSGTSQLLFSRKRIPPKEHAPEEDEDLDAPLYADTIDSLFVATKAHSVVPLIRQLLHRIRPSSTIVLVHNGMGVYERLVQEIFRNHENRPHIIFTCNTHGAYTIGQKVVHASHRGAGTLRFGIVPDPRGRDYEVRRVSPTGERTLSLDSISPPDDPDPEHYASLRNTVAVLSSLSGLLATWEPISDIVIAMKRKVVVNSIINPLTAIMNCRNGDILDSPNTHRIARMVCEEAALAFAMEHNTRLLDAGRKFALPRRLQPKDHFKAAVLSRLPLPLRADGLVSEVFRIAKSTAWNSSSMVQDIRANRSTEIEFLNGYLVGLGRKYNIKMHINAFLADMMRLRQDVPLDVLQDLPPRTSAIASSRGRSSNGGGKCELSGKGGKLNARPWLLRGGKPAAQDVLHCHMHRREAEEAGLR
ncbi:ketopantoate reductase PanE/ApbA C terminal-domain-containing protein [Vararia minispora EC-137]|uniref:Ketopantoate reductase PanE/ApbA C terminal-domain-containing protein n=1 Tax=Vararia minispora EC-137 TaxID=1314806 RepID=A0ACB8QHU0_9AGAM|nr:ketopantoate reductase PanE/ApbA C terminal-domain-containing protein [Vararia minispora EC-137]